VVIIEIWEKIDIVMVLLKSFLRGLSPNFYHSWDRVGEVVSHVKEDDLALEKN
jgi:hypothetical protein